MNRELPKTYEPAEIEAKWYRLWVEQGYFRADETLPKMPYCIPIPPPNVTGSLHLGHALTATIEDVLIRWRRMSGYNALWTPGTDHAGIATQMVVERQLAKETGQSRHDLGREKFLERVWKWKEQSGNRILEQLKAMGASCDWSRTRFTMDPEYSGAVREAFVRLHEQGLIYRARRLINWCPRCYTALSDLEVEHKEQSGHLWHIAYPVAGGAEKLVVATTRPETMLGDTAVAVHPEDLRHKHLVGKSIDLPLSGRQIPVIADDVLVDKEFGSGAVKVTPGHDFNDFACGERHGLAQLTVIDLHGKICAPAPAKYVGMTVGEARKAVVEDLEAAGLLERVEDHKHAVARCDRCDTVLEPELTMQWFVKTAPLAAPAIEAVESGKTRIVPEVWEKTYFHWMRNIKDWCISRQLWWGHRIPAFYCDCGEITVSRKDIAACPKCNGAVRQDDDVLDTWFSSGLWPFATLGWPEKTRDLAMFSSASVLETGHDILFFWVARMMMMGIHFMGKPPFRTVFLHSLVVDDQGEKMSKVKGNVIDPLDVTSQYGADALRFTLAALAAQGRNIRMSTQRVEGYRHFANKVWNAARFVLMNLDGYDADQFIDLYRDEDSLIDLDLPDRWILSRLQQTVREVDGSLEEFRINDAAQAVYKFIWNELCDWYIEMVKPALRPADGEAEGARMRRRMTQGVLAVCLETSMRLLHPFMPFLTEEIWQQVPKPSGTPASIMVTMFGAAEERFIDADAERQVALLKDVVSGIRMLRNEYNVPPKARLHATLVCGSSGSSGILEQHARFLRELAGVEHPTITLDAARRPGGITASTVVGDVEVFVPLGDVIDIAAERTRIKKDVDKAKKEADGVEKKLGNEAFVARAPVEVVEENRTRLSETRERIGRLEAALGRLEGK